MKSKNLFLQPSVVLAFISLFIIQGDAVFDSIIENGFTPQNLKDLVVTVAVVGGIIVERYNEDDEGTMYTPPFILGRNKEDADKNANGILDRYETTKENSFPVEEGVVNHREEW